MDLVGPMDETIPLGAAPAARGCDLAKKSITDDRKKLRADAEERFLRDPPAEASQPPSSEHLHELQVHQIELEMQNDELRRTQAELEETRDRFVDLYDFSPVGYFTVGESGLITGVNLTGGSLLGLDRQLLVGRQFSAFVDPEDGDRWHLLFVKASRHSERQAVEVKLRRPDGTQFYGWLELVPAWSESGPVFRIALADITEHKRVEEELRATQAQLAVSARLAAMGTLVAGVAHEVNNPLTATLSDIEVALKNILKVRDRLQLSDTVEGKAEAVHLDAVAEMLNEAQEAARRIERIVKDLKAFGRSDSEKTRVRLVDVVQQAMRWLPATVTRVATVKVENGAPPDVVASFGQIQQVVVALVANAARATHASRFGTIILRMVPGSPGMARLDVIDNGVGIDPKIASRIFDPFFTTGDVGQGMGLGLSISHALVTAHGGTLTVMSEVGKGSTFRVELPAAPAEVAG